MLPNGQNPEQVLGQKLSPTQVILWNWIFSTFQPTNIEPLCYAGPSAGTPYIVYDAHILYIAFQYIVPGYTYSAALPVCAFYDQNNVTKYSHYSDPSYWDATATAARFSGQTFILTNIWFSRVAATPASLDFIGYRITY